MSSWQRLGFHTQPNEKHKAHFSLNIPFPKQSMPTQRNTMKFEVRINQKHNNQLKRLLSSLSKSKVCRPHY